MSHRNAKLTPAGRLLIVQRIQLGWTQANVAEAQGVSRSTVAKWWKRFHEHGLDGLGDASSCAHRRPHALGQPVVEAILALRQSLGAGPHRIAYELGMAPSTVYGVLKRHGLAVLAQLDRTTRSVIRYEREHPGELIHLDVKRLGRIPDGGGKRFDEGFAETGAGRHRPGKKRGHDFVHVAVDDHSRFAYVEILPDERGETTVGFLLRTVQAFAEAGITVQRVLTDNGGNYRSDAYKAAASALGLGLRYTRPYRPQTNGKAEALVKTLQREWAYRRPYRSNDERSDALPPWVLDYNFVRPHTSLGNRPPASRL